MAQAGIASRRECEALITAGRVRVNGQIVRILGTRVHPERDEIRVDGDRVRREAQLTVMLNKPAGYLCTRSDPQGRPLVGSLLPAGNLPHLFPVGRLDWESEGLLLLTNDGELANVLTHPRHGVQKVYQVKLKGQPADELLRRMVQGVVSEGERLSAVAVEKLSLTRENSWVAITVVEGRFHHVRRMCEAIGHRVQKLIRTHLGPLSLGNLPRGQWRPLTPPELEALAQLKARFAGERP